MNDKAVRAGEMESIARYLNERVCAENRPAVDAVLAQIAASVPESSMARNIKTILGEDAEATGQAEEGQADVKAWMRANLSRPTYEMLLGLMNDYANTFPHTEVAGRIRRFNSLSFWPGVGPVAIATLGLCYAASLG